MHNIQAIASVGQSHAANTTQPAAAGGTSKGGGHRSARREAYKLADLPAGTHRLWQRVYVAMFLDYVGQRADPWDSSHFVPAAQRLWERVYPDNSHVLAAKGDAVYALVSLSAFIHNIFFTE